MGIHAEHWQEKPKRRKWGIDRFSVCGNPSFMGRVGLLVDHDGDLSGFL